MAIQYAINGEKACSSVKWMFSDLRTDWCIIITHKVILKSWSLHIDDDIHFPIGNFHRKMDVHNNCFDKPANRTQNSHHEVDTTPRFNMYKIVLC